MEDIKNRLLLFLFINGMIILVIAMLVGFGMFVKLSTEPFFMAVDRISVIINTEGFRIIEGLIFLLCLAVW